MPDKPVQQLFDFDAAAGPRAEAVRYKPSRVAVDALGRLESWLKDPRTGRMSSVAEEAVEAVRRALLEGKNGWWHKAEDELEALRLRNGPVRGDDVPAGVTGDGGPDFHEAVEDLLDCLRERLRAWVAGM